MRIPQELLINAQIRILEHIEDDPDICLLCMQEGCHRLDCDFRRWFMGKVKFPGGYAAKSNALAVVFHSQLQAGTITGGQPLTILLSDGAADHRPHGMQDMLAGQIEGRGDLCLADGFFMSLPAHHVTAEEPKLDAASGVDDVVDTGMERMKTA